MSIRERGPTAAIPLCTSVPSSFPTSVSIPSSQDGPARVDETLERARSCHFLLQMYLACLPSELLLLTPLFCPFSTPAALCPASATCCHAFLLTCADLASCHPHLSSHVSFLGTHSSPPPGTTPFPLLSLHSVGCLLYYSAYLLTPEKAPEGKLPGMEQHTYSLPWCCADGAWPSHSRLWSLMRLQSDSNQAWGIWSG